MTIQANDVHVRTVQAYSAFQAHPDLHPFMQEGLKSALKKQAQLLSPLLAKAGAATDADESAAAKIDAVYAASHALVVRIHEGLRYRYAETHPEVLAGLAPMRAGRTPAADEVRLSTMILKLPALHPAYPWIEGELTLAILQKQLKAHHAADAQLPALMQNKTGVLEALAALREARPASHELWSDEGGRLEAWIVANVPASQQYAFGRERRQKARTAGAPPQTTTTATK